MSVEIKIPSPGESITEVRLARWLIGDGSAVEQDQELAEIDSDKATFPISAPVSGRITFKAAEGDTLAVGTLIAILEPSGTAGRPSPGATPLARRIISDRKIDESLLVSATGSRKITRKDVEHYLRKENPDTPDAAVPEMPVIDGSRRLIRRKLTTLRQKLAERLVAVKNETAMLTTFNEVNMAPVIGLREKYASTLKEQYGPGPGYVSFFAKASAIALQEFPLVNSMIDGDELVTPAFVDLGIAVSAPKGLVVPVIRNAEALNVFEIEDRLRELAGKARENRISIDEMKGGTFTITNGGVFGSLMSTPILNPPQSAILGMHKIQDRPVAAGGRVVILPMMYMALSYDHRVIDGRESVGFLIRIKELLEAPEALLGGGSEMERRLLEKS